MPFENILQNHNRLHNGSSVVHSIIPPTQHQHLGCLKREEVVAGWGVGEGGGGVGEVAEGKGVEV